MSNLKSIPPPAALIATLGTEPQVVTAGLDLLLEQGERIQEVCVVHTTDPGTPIGAAVEALRRAAADYPALSFAFAAIMLDGAAVRDVDTLEASQAGFSELYRQLLRAKQAGRRAHLLIAGGRKTMSVYGMAAAQVLFDAGDRLWHLFSAGEFLRSRRLHPQPGDAVQLVEIPLLRYDGLTPALLANSAELSRIEDPFEAFRRVEQLQLAGRLRRIRVFIARALTPQERRVVELLVKDGLSYQDIAARLVLSPRTIENHMRSACQKAADEWGLESASRTQLMALLGLYYQTQLGDFTQDKAG